MIPGVAPNGRRCQHVGRASAANREESLGTPGRSMTSESAPLGQVHVEPADGEASGLHEIIDHRADDLCTAGWEPIETE